MKSRTTRSFWKHYWQLQPDVQRRAQKSFELWRSNPSHPGLRFKRLKKSQPLFSVRVGSSHRALGLLRGDTIFWFWIGDHDDYEQLLKRYG